MPVTEQNVDAFMKSTIKESLTGKTTEHSFRPFFKDLFENIEGLAAINEPSRSEYGAPDFVFLNQKNADLIRGYAEMKDLDANLDEIEKTNQIDRYKGYKSIILTNGLDWRFFRNGVKYFELTIAVFDNKEKKITGVYKKRYSQLADEINAFFEQTPEQLTNGARLAEIMGGKARRIRDNVRSIISDEHLKADHDIDEIFGMMRALLVSDLTYETFADMYAQTLVYGLFVARYNDDTPDNFSRFEARDLVPKTNPFLREFFDHITGSNFNKTLSYIVDELCEIFAVSDIKEIVHKHLKITEDSANETKDPIIHFYEDFLAAYDPVLRKSMGAYYTPIPVVKYIVRMVDKALKEDFGIADGISSNEKIKYTHQVDQYFEGNSKIARHERTDMIPKVQILDPAVGTATFLNETIKYIYHEKFSNNAGMWPAYVNDNILPRLNGFELMMTPYTIAHLKLGMTLSELGANDLNSRLKVFLTNTLTEGESVNLPLFALLGLTKVVADESKYASEVKNSLPVMVVMGNPPYSVSSSNKSDFIQNLIMEYKKDLGERKINLDDDYIKFIRFSEYMVEKNGCGIVAMITNNSYIDGITHRKMREHLLNTFDKIYILDLHGNSKKKETSPDGTPDQNVFDIMQGVSIIVAISKNANKKAPGRVYHAELYGSRSHKFESLNKNEIEYTPLNCNAPNFFFVPKDDSLTHEYNSGVDLGQLFVNKSSGFRTGADGYEVAWDEAGIRNVVSDLISLTEQEFRDKYSLKDGRNHNYVGMRSDVDGKIEEDRIIKFLYRPFDIRCTYYSWRSSGFVAWPRNQTMNNFVAKTNVGMVFTRLNRQLSLGYSFVSELVADEHILDSASDSTVIAPLYVYYPDGTKVANFNPDELKKFTGKIGSQTPEDIFDYIYAVLYSPSYREKYKEFLKIGFPIIPIADIDTFNRLVPLGRRLRELHLMHADSASDVHFPNAGTNIVEKPYFENNKVWINDDQFFDNVSELAWKYYIGGYQPAQKWLKERKGRTLSYDDIEHYRKIITILEETDRIMNEIG